MSHDWDLARRTAVIANLYGPAKRPTGHRWTADVRGDQPVMTCTNAGCRIVWWPDRNEPRSTCAHQPEGDRT